jgi:hypothetical protein
MVFEIEYYNREQAAASEVDTIVGNFIRPFDLSQAPLLRVGLIKLEKKKHILMVDSHHILSDGTSHAILIREFAAHYQGIELRPLKIQYKDYSQWQSSTRGKESMASQKAYMIGQFKGETPVLNLPVDYERPGVRSFKGHRLSFRIEDHEVKLLKEIVAAANATLYMVLLTVFNIFLAKICGQEEVVVGTPSAGRNHPDLQSVIGMFVNTLVLKNCCSREKTFEEFLIEVRDRTLEAFENQDYQFDDLVDEVLEERKPGRNPLFDVMIVLQNIEVQAKDIPETQLSGLQVEPYGHRREDSILDMTFVAYETREGMMFSLHYNTQLFKQKKIERFIIYFKEIVSTVTKNKTIPLEDIVISHDLSATGKKILREDQGDFAF